MTRHAPLCLLFVALAACSPERPTGVDADLPDPAGGAVTEPAFTAGETTSLLDPARDGWDSEVLSAAADEQLHRIADFFSDPTTSLDEFASPDFASPALVPTELEERFDDGVVSVAAAAPRGRPTESLRGAAGLAAALAEQAARLGELGDRRAKLKLFKIELDDDASFVTRSYFEVSGRDDDGSKQINATWATRWAHPAGESGRPLLLAVEVSAYEETRVLAPGGVLFEDVTEAGFGHNRSYGEQLLETPEQWLSRLTKEHGFSKDGWHGVSVADANGDGLDDVFLPEQGGLPNRLFVQNAIGTFDDRSAEAGLDFLEPTRAGLFVDLDNDGDQDLVLSHRPAILVLENDGTGVFEQIRFASGAVPDSHSLSAADYDNDGDLDLYVCAYRRAPDERGIASPVPYHDARNGGRNALLRNDGGFRFTDVTVAAGLDVNNRRFSLAAAWEDFDNDGDADLYVANDYGRNNLYRNDGSGAGGEVRFTDVAAEAAVEDISSGMSVTWGDYDHDGWMDVYVGNMFSAAGNRITYQRKFEEDRQRAGRLEDVQRMARGNSLFRNTGRGTFVDRSEAEEVTMGRWSWSSLFADLNNDGFEDLVIANGNLTQTEPDDL
ncbi:MAG: VCBS repeat-containing protein [Thermoanaerobaculia bacterium]|nr:VCBS repeat-containing protein [Thermoanaerobaculia bacterium]